MPSPFVSGGARCPGCPPAALLVECSATLRQAWTGFHSNKGPHTWLLSRARRPASAPSWIRTSGLPLRRGTLYPAELSGPAARMVVADLRLGGALGGEQVAQRV